MLMINFSVV